MRVVTRVLVAATLAFGLGCAQTDWIDRTLVTENVAGVWAESMVSQGGQPAVSQDFRLELQQQGAKVVGSFHAGTGWSSVARGSTPIEGSVAGDMFRFKDARGTLSGEVTISGDEMTGHGIFGIRPVAITLRRVEASPPPTSPPR